MSHIEYKVPVRPPPTPQESKELPCECGGSLGDKKGPLAALVGARLGQAHGAFVQPQDVKFQEFESAVPASPLDCRGPVSFNDALKCVFREQCIVYGLPGSGKTKLQVGHAHHCADTDNMGPAGCPDEQIYTNVFAALKAGKTLFTNRWRMLPIIAQHYPVYILEPPPEAAIVDDTHGGVKQQKAWCAEFPWILQALRNGERGVAMLPLRDKLDTLMSGVDVKFELAEVLAKISQLSANLAYAGVPPANFPNHPDMRELVRERKFLEGRLKTPKITAPAPAPKISNPPPPQLSVSQSATKVEKPQFSPTELAVWKKHCDGEEIVPARLRAVFDIATAVRPLLARCEEPREVVVAACSAANAALRKARFSVKEGGDGVDFIALDGEGAIDQFAAYGIQSALNQMARTMRSISVDERMGTIISGRYGNSEWSQLCADDATPVECYNPIVKYYLKLRMFLKTWWPWRSNDVRSSDCDRLRDALRDHHPVLPTLTDFLHSPGRVSFPPSSTAGQRYLRLAIRLFLFLIVSGALMLGVMRTGVLPAAAGVLRVLVSQCVIVATKLPRFLLGTLANDRCPILTLGAASALFAWRPVALFLYAVSIASQYINGYGDTVAPNWLHLSVLSVTCALMAFRGVRCGATTSSSKLKQRTIAGLEPLQ